MSAYKTNLHETTYVHYEWLDMQCQSPAAPERGLGDDVS